MTPLPPLLPPLPLTAFQACGSEADNMQVHLHEEHGPDGPHREIRRGIGSAVVVHRWGGWGRRAEEEGAGAEGESAGGGGE